MSWIKPKAKDPYVFIWETQPFAFVPGYVYIVQINTNKVDMKEVKELTDFFKTNGVNVKLVAVRLNVEWALQPIVTEIKKEYK